MGESSMNDAAAGSGPSTYFAPAERDDATSLETAREQFLANRLAVTLLDAIPDLALVLNTNRQIIAFNRRVLQTLGVDGPERVVGLRPGEAVQCVNCKDAPNGCGTGRECRVCGAVNATLEAIETRGSATRECRIRTERGEDGGALDLEVQATFFCVDGTELVMLAMRDISAEKRRSVLERAFFHDVLNTAGGLQGIAELLCYGEDDPQSEAEYIEDLRRMSQQIVDEIVAHRQLLAAERGELELDMTPVAIPELVDSVAELYRHHSVAEGRHLVVAECPDSQMLTDPTLLRRVLGNLVKNALEAVGEGETVTISAAQADGAVRFSVHNPGAIPEDVARQVFQRSFSTKGGSGRGIGTHSVKLLAESYLGGKVTFASTEAEGTTFTVEVPE